MNACEPKAKDPQLGHNPDENSSRSSASPLLVNYRTHFWPIYRRLVRCRLCTLSRLIFTEYRSPLGLNSSEIGSDYASRSSSPASNTAPPVRRTKCAPPSRPTWYHKALSESSVLRRCRHVSTLTRGDQTSMRGCCCALKSVDRPESRGTVPRASHPKPSAVRISLATGTRARVPLARRGNRIPTPATSNRYGLPTEGKRDAVCREEA